MDWPDDDLWDEPPARESGADPVAGPAAGEYPLRTHPDLRALGRRLRVEMDETLRAEQFAARVAARRRSTIRDRLLLAEDRGERLAVGVADGSVITGDVVGVGADHLVLATSEERCWIGLNHVLIVRTSTP